MLPKPCHLLQMFKKRTISENARKRTKDEKEEEELASIDNASQIEVSDLLELRKHKRKLAGMSAEQLLQTTTRSTAYFDDDPFKKAGLRVGFAF